MRCKQTIKSSLQMVNIRKDILSNILCDYFTLAHVLQLVNNINKGNTLQTSQQLVNIISKDNIFVKMVKHLLRFI